jgi:hypothetical protein
MLTVCCAVTPAGAVYKPVGLIDPPPAGFNVQVTAVLLALATVATNCCVCPEVSVADMGTTLTETGGIRVTTAETDELESPTVVAVTVTVCCVSMLRGAL